jgi:carbon starvation protein CstA
MAMSQSAIIRFALPIAILVILASLYAGLHGPSQSLLTPPPGGFVAVTMLVVVGLALFAGIMLARDVPSRLGRRLVLLAAMGISIYLGGESARGLYAINAFDGELQTVTERWMTLRGQGETITAASLERRNKSIQLASSAEAAAAASLGQCVNVQIEKSAGGAERIAAEQAKISTSDLSPC